MMTDIVSTNGNKVHHMKHPKGKKKHWLRTQKQSISWFHLCIALISTAAIMKVLVYDPYEVLNTIKTWETVFRFALDMYHILVAIIHVLIELVSLWFVLIIKCVQMYNELLEMNKILTVGMTTLMVVFFRCNVGAKKVYRRSNRMAIPNRSNKKPVKDQ